MILFYGFFSFLMLFFVSVLIWAIVTDIWRKTFVTKISKMTNHEINNRLSILFDVQDNEWSPKKKLEFELLLKELYKRKIK